MDRFESHPINYPASLGAYLAVNAVSDAYILMDGPDCVMYKAQLICGRHDINSTLLRPRAPHRVVFSNVCPQGSVKDHQRILERALRAIAAQRDCGVILLSSLPSCAITGVDYERLSRRLAPALRPAVVPMPSASLSGDWLDGYGASLLALAKRLKLPAGGRRRGTAAVVGYLMDRNEGEHAGNVAELRRLLAGLSVDLVSVWLDGGDTARLARASRADLVISLPHGRAAARELASRTGARLVETGLPFGLGATGRWLTRVAEAAGRRREARRFIDAELSSVVPKVRWLLPYLFLGRSTVFIGDPFYLSAFVELARELGLDLKACVASSLGKHLRGEALAGVPVAAGVDINDPGLLALLRSPPDLVVSVSHEIVGLLDRHKTAYVEFGYPSYFRHTLSETPFLGYKGFLAFVDRLAGALSDLKRSDSVHAGKWLLRRGEGPLGESAPPAPPR
ncbi:MAG: hypothetical protein HY927_08750 [Elusimicrobia bacterium]|nr:hypothetical protein [Elusimicrobiota bacterium]